MASTWLRYALVPVITATLAAPGRGQGAVLDPPQFDFGAVQVGSSRTLTLTITTEDVSPLIVTRVYVLTDPAGVFDVWGVPDVFPWVVLPDEERYVEFRFSPTSPGPHAGIVIVECNDHADPEIDVPVAGEGVLLVPRESCSGDGGVRPGCTPCPCGNEAPAGTIGGCLNSAGTSTRLVAYGSGSLSAGDLGFEVTGAPPGVMAVLFSGADVAPTNPAHPCFGLDSGVRSPVLDGLRCVVDGVRRHGTRYADAAGTIGVTTEGWGGAQPLVNASTFAAGTSRHFQVVHRDDDDLVCFKRANTSQAVGLTFVP